MKRPVLLGALGCALAVAGAPAWSAGTVTISGQFTTFQSALSPFVAGGNGTLGSDALVIDPALPPVRYIGDPSTAYLQSQVVTLGAGTSEVVFRYSDLTAVNRFNRVAFQAAGPATVNVGERFKVGTITYQNGFWFPYARVGLRIQVSSADPALNGHSFEGAIVVAVSSPEPSLADPIANADYFYLTGVSGPLTTLGSVRVYEPHIQPAGNPGNVGSADLYVRIGSLIPTDFANPSAAAFLSSSLEPIAAVPEPSTWALWALGAWTMLGAARRRTRR
jgi:hypothetical protein